MPLESGTYISDLVATNPVGATDPKSEGDDHIRLIKSTLKNTFPNITGKVEAAQADLPKCNFSATADPGVNDDSGSNYAVGSRWVNVTDDTHWVCVDATAGAAVWVKTNPLSTPVSVANGGTGATDAATARANLEVPEVTGGNILCPHENLVVTRTTTSTVRVQADALLLKDSSGNPKRVTSVDVTVDITASGAGGVDTGAEAVSTWYYVHVIAKSDGTVSAVFSTSSTSPTMPTGYTYKGLVSAIFNNSDGNLRKLWQYGNEATQMEDNLGGTGTYVARFLNGGTATTPTSVSLANYMPPITKVARIHVIHTGTTTTSSSSLSRDMSTTGSSVYGDFMIVNVAASIPSRHFGYLTVNDDMTLKYLITSGDGAVYADVFGWRFD